MSTGALNVIGTMNVLFLAYLHIEIEHSHRFSFAIARSSVDVGWKFFLSREADRHQNSGTIGKCSPISGNGKFEVKDSALSPWHVLVVGPLISISTAALHSLPTYRLPVFLLLSFAATPPH